MAIPTTRKTVDNSSGTGEVPLDSVTQKPVEFSTSWALESILSSVPVGSVNGLFSVT